MKNIWFLLVLLVTIKANADVLMVEGKIAQVQLMSTNYTTYSTAGEAIALIWMSELPVACGNSSGFKRVAITSSHPAYNVVVSAALAAKAANQTIQLSYVDSCTLWNNNAWDFAIFKTI